MSLVRFKIYLDKSVDENASLYFQKSKIVKKKIEGAEKIIEEMKKQVEKSNNYVRISQSSKIPNTNSEVLDRTQLSWYAKFRWFFTQHGFLLVGAKDAGSNEEIVKKHLSENDLVFHTSSPGSPFFILKLDRYYNDDELLNLKEDIESSAQITASYSKAWSLGLTYTDVFYVRPNQITKKTKSGEFLSRGSFMVYGKRNFLTVKLELAVGKLPSEKSKCRLLFFTPQLVSSRCKKYFVISPGNRKKSDVVKTVLSKLVGKKEAVYLNQQEISKLKLHDFLLSFIPSGSSYIEEF